MKKRIIILHPPHRNELNEKNQQEVVGKADEDFGSYAKYIKVNGYHFTDELAEHASKMLYDKMPLQYITKQQISDLIETSKINMHRRVTLGDMIYAINNAHSLFYPDLLKDVKSCLVHAAKVVNSMNGYEGVIFRQWLADTVGKGEEINWDNYI